MQSFNNNLIGAAAGFLAAVALGNTIVNPSLENHLSPEIFFFTLATAATATAATVGCALRRRNITPLEPKIAPPPHEINPDSFSDELSAAASLSPSHDSENKNLLEEVFSKPPEELTWEDLEAISKIKRKGKERQGDHRLTNSERSDEQMRIDRCIRVIESIEMLRDLRSVRKYFQMRQEERKSDPQNRNPTRPNERTDQATRRINSILRNTERYVEASLDFLATFTKADWKETKRALWQGLQEARQTDLKADTLTWLTGTNSPSIPLIKEVAKRNIVARPSLVPSGILLENDIIPLSGELFVGIEPSGVNIKNLSGVLISGIETAVLYATRSNCLFNRDHSIERIFSLNPYSNWMVLKSAQVSLHRLLMLEADEDLRARLQTHIQTVASNYLDIDPEWKSNIFYAGMSAPEGLGHCPEANEIISAGTMVVFEGCIYPVYSLSMEDGILQGFISNTNGYCLAKIPKEELRILSKTDLAQLQKPEKPNKALKKQMRDSISYVEYGRKFNEKMLALFDRVKPIDFEEIDLIEEPFPIVWGSQTLNPTPFYGGCDGEQTVEGVVPMGEEIQWAFTRECRTKRLEQSVCEIGIQVLSFLALNILLEYPQRMKAVTDPSAEAEAAPLV